jgi:ATP-dependent Clp protease ATP-binding subunit ClpC
MIDDSSFGPRVRTVLAAANNEAVLLHHPYISTEHLLVGLLHEGQGVAITVLKNLGVDLTELQAQVRALVAPGAPDAPGAGDVAKRPYTARAMRALALADAEARTLGHAYLATEHLLLGLIEEAGGVAGHAFHAAGVRADAVRAEIARVLGMQVPQAD